MITFRKHCLYDPTEDDRYSLGKDYQFSLTWNPVVMTVYTLTRYSRDSFLTPTIRAEQPFVCKMYVHGDYLGEPCVMKCTSCTSFIARLML